MKCAILYGTGWYVGDVKDAPPVGALGIIYPDPCTRGMDVGTLHIRGWDYYLLEDNHWVGVNGEVDLIDHVLHENPQKVIKGRMVPRNKWQAALKELEGFPTKSAIAKGFETPEVYIPDGVTI